MRKITYYNSVATAFRQFTSTLRTGDKFPWLRAIKLGGEAILSGDIELVRRHFPPDCVVYMATGGYGGRCEAPLVPGQQRPETDQEYVAPRTLFETLLAGIWADLLKLDCVGIHDEFLELGGIPWWRLA